MSDPTPPSDDCGCAESLEKELGSVDFSTFVLSLGTQALWSMGFADNAETGKREVDLRLARHFIDILGMMQAKTAGNLSADEGRLLQTLLFDLRLKYVDVCKAQAEKKPA